MDNEAFYEPAHSYLWALTASTCSDKLNFSLIGPRWAGSYQIDDDYVRIRNSNEYWTARHAKTKEHRQRIILASVFKVNQWA